MWQAAPPVPSRRPFVAALVLWLGLGLLDHPRDDLRGAEPPPQRRVYVPVEDLDVVVDKVGQGVLLPRDEFQKLWEAAQKSREQTPPTRHAVIFSQATYSGEIHDDQLLISATFELQQLAPGWQSVSLPLRGLAIEKATLDDQPAQLGREPLRPIAATKAVAPAALPRPWVLLLNQPGKHVLKLQLTAPLVTVGSDKVTAFFIPPVAAAQLQLPLAANQHLYVQEVPLSRPAPVEQPAQYAVALGGKSQVALRITDRKQQVGKDSLVFASTSIGVHVAPEELTWQAVNSLQVYGRPIDVLEYLVPKSLEMVAVESTGLERWEIQDGPNDRTTRLKLVYRQPFTENRQVTLRGVTNTVIGEPWSVPTLQLVKATSHTLRVLVQHPSELRVQVVETTGLRRTASAGQGAPGTATMPTMPDMAKKVDPTQQLHFAAWQEDFSLILVTQNKAREVQATIATRLDIDSRELTLRSSLFVVARFAPLFELELTLPAEWTVREVLHQNKPLQWREIPEEAGLREVRITFHPPLPPGQRADLILVAHSVPSENWPLEELPLTFRLPEVYLPQAGVTEGTYLVATDDDLDVFVEELMGLDPARLPAATQPAPGQPAAQGRAPKLVYEYQDTRFQGQLRVSRKPTQITARTWAFHRLDPEVLFTHFDTALILRGGGLRKLQVALSESLGEDLQFHLHHEYLQLTEQTASPAKNGERVWTLQFDQRLRGLANLVVTARTPRTKNGAATQLPILRVLGAETQDGYIAIEAGPEQQLNLQALSVSGSPLKEVDWTDVRYPPELSYAPPYFPQERIVATYQAILPGYKVTLQETRFDKHAVPTAVCDRVDLQSILGGTGEFQHRATFTLRAIGVQSLRVSLPPEAHLWSTLLDGTPIEVRRVVEKDGHTFYLIPWTAASLDAGLFPQQMNIPVAQNVPQRTLQLFYRTALASNSVDRTWQQQPPRLTVVNGQGEPQPLETLSREWQVYYPHDNILTASTGQFEPTEKPHRDSFLGRAQRSIRLGNPDELQDKAWLVIVVGGALWIVAFTYRRRGPLVAGGVAVLLGVACLTVALLSVSKQTFMLGGSATKSAYAPHSSVTSSPAYPHADGDMPMAAEAAGSPAPQLEAATTDQPTAPTSAPMDALPEPKAKRDDPSSSRADATKPPTNELSKKLSGAFKEAAGPDDARKAGEKKEDEQQHLPREQGEREKVVKSLRESRLGDNKGEGGQPLAQPAPGRPPLSGPQDNAAPTTPFEPKLSLEIRQTQTLQPQGPAAETGGKLSLTMHLEPPPDSRLARFTYSGSPAADVEPQLSVRFQNLDADRHWTRFWALAVIVGCWFLRTQPWGVKAGLAALGLSLPLAFVTLVPLHLLSLLDGLFLGSLGGIVLWVLWGAWCTLTQRWQQWSLYVHRHMPSRQTTASLLMGCSLAVGMTVTVGPQHSLWGADPVPAKPAQPPATPQPEFRVIIPFNPAHDPQRADKVFLPLDKFRELWQAAHPEAALPAPVDFLLSEALFSARLIPPTQPAAKPAEPKPADVKPADAKPADVKPAETKPAEVAPATTTAPMTTAPTSKAVVEVTGRLVVHTYRARQVAVPLPLGVVALSKIELDGKTAPLTATHQGTPQLAILIDQPGLHIIDLTFSVPAELTGPAGRFTFPLRGVPTGVLRFPLPAADVTLKANGAIGVYRLVKQGPEQTAYLTLGDQNEITLSWAPKTSRDQAEAIVHVESATAITLGDAGLRLSAGFQFMVRQGTLPEVTFALPAGLLVRQISGLDLGGWEVTGEGAERRLKVFLRRPVNDSTQLQFDLYSPHEFTEEPKTIPVPAFGPVGLTRETGLVGIFAEPQLAVSTGTTTGLSQIDASQFQCPMRLIHPPTPPQFAYRYAARPFQLPLIVSRLKPRSQAVAEHGLSIGPRKLRMATRLVWDLAGAPRSELQIQLPPGYLLNDITFPGMHDYYVAPAQNGNDGQPLPRLLRIELTRPTTGRVICSLDGTIPRDPQQPHATLAVPLPLGVNDVRTTAAVWVDPSYIGSVQETAGWKALDPAQLPATLKRLRPQPPQFAFTSTLMNPAPFDMQLARAVPRVSGQVLDTILVNETSIEHQLILQWQIAQAGEKTFTFTTPEYFADRLQVRTVTHGPRLRQISQTKLENQRLRWTITLEDAQRQKFVLFAEATLPPPVNARVDMPLVTLEEAVDRENAVTYRPLESQDQFVVLVNQSPQPLQSGAADALEPVSADDLPFRFDSQERSAAGNPQRQAISLRAAATEIARVKDRRRPIFWQIRPIQQLKALPATVTLAEMNLVIARDGTWRGQTNFRVFNRARQFLALKMPAESTVLSLFVGGIPARPVHTTRQGQELLLAPLPKASEADLATEVVLVYKGKFPTHLPRGVQVFRSQFDLPAPRVVSQQEDADLGMPVSRTSWAVYVPQDLDLKLLDDLDRTNMEQVEVDRSRVLSLLNEAVQLSNYYISSDESISSKQQSKAYYNLKFLQQGIQQAESYGRTSSVPPRQPAQQDRQLLEYNELLTRNQRAVQEADSKNSLANSVTPGGPNPAQKRTKLMLKDLQQEWFDNNEFSVSNGTTSVTDDPGFRFEIAAEAAPQTKAPDEKPGADTPPQAKGGKFQSRSELRSQAQSQSLQLNEAAQAAQPQASSQPLPQVNLFDDREQSTLEMFQRMRQDNDQNLPGNFNANPDGYRLGQQGQNQNRLYANPNAQRPGQQPLPGQPPAGGSNWTTSIFGQPQQQQLGGNAPLAPLPSITGGAGGMGGGGGAGPGGMMANTELLDVSQGQAAQMEQGYLGWSSAGGLSLLIQIPQDGRRYSFVKLGGDPQLAVGLRPLASADAGVGLVWCLVWIAIGLGLAAALNRAQSYRRILRQFPVAATPLGLIWFFALPGAALGFVLFVLGAFGLAWRYRNAPSAT